MNEETKTNGTEQWAILNDFSWNGTQPDGERIEPIRPLHVIPMDKDQAAFKFITEQIFQMGMALEEFVSRFIEYANWNERRVIRIKDKPVLLFPDADLRLLVEDYENVTLTFEYTCCARGSQTTNKDSSFNALKDVSPDIPAEAWRFCNEDEAKILFGKFDSEIWHKYQPNHGKYSVAAVSLQGNQYLLNGSCKIFNNKDQCNSADVYVTEMPDDMCWLECLLQWNLIPEKAAGMQGWSVLESLYDQGFLSMHEKPDGTLGIGTTQEFLQAVQDGKLKEVGPFFFETELEGGEELYSFAWENILNCDEQRANISPYDEAQLKDPSRGSWELWDLDPAKNLIMSIPDTIYARDPRLDVVEGGVVGIDFGTKNTVVVCQEDTTRIQLMRIGHGQYQQEISAKDYENPTVMELVDLASFLRAYGEDRGRPFTKWDDLLVSHTAYSDWESNHKSERYFSFVSGLKQWAGNSGQRLHLRDRKDHDWTLPPYTEMRDYDPDPIELYAYYIGLFVNNMHRGQIYLEYLLSFPVTYAKDIRDRILSSFRRGLQKSMPSAVLKDEECMSRFSVRQGAGEPAAYAVCALQEYGLRPKEDEEIRYSVFDFGGGTADFDYGTWKRAPKPKAGRGRYDYVIRHFGDGGDPYLGGENLLEMLAFHVFRTNQETLREKRITFCLPPHCERFPGSEMLLAESQEAHSNMRKLTTVLRPLWENTEEELSKNAAGRQTVELFTKDRDTETVELSIDCENLVGLLRQRIREGVSQFFAGLMAAFGDSDKWTPVHIFLAGNSSKSPLLQEIFKEEIARHSRQICGETLEKAQNDAYIDSAENSDTQEDPSTRCFSLYPALGTDLANRRLQELGLRGESKEKDIERPTGKTGVAFGLIQCREGSRIKVEDERHKEEEIRFRYWIGTSDADGFFEPVLGRNTPYQQWIEYLDAGETYFEFYYTNLPKGEYTGELRVEETKKRRLTIPESAKNESWMIYLRAVGPCELEYTVSMSQEDADGGRFQCEPQKAYL